jgi:hypothetical protein
MVAQRSTVTLQDIADLAHVSRHVVTMWRGRRRVRGRDLPFPDVVSLVDGVERFDRDDAAGVRGVGGGVRPLSSRAARRSHEAPWSGVGRATAAARGDSGI